MTQIYNFSAGPALSLIHISMPDEAALDAESNQHVQLDDVVESAPAETPNTNAQQFADVQPSNANTHTEPTPVATAEIVPAVGLSLIHI